MNGKPLLLSLAACVTLLGAAPAPSARGAFTLQACDEDPPDGYTRSIHGVVGGDELTLRVSARFGGAVESLTWRDKEFINTWDHGRQISYAWGMDEYGECLNPTEPGSANDYQRLDSTSRLLEVCSPSSNVLTTKTQPAYWLVPGQSGFCGGGARTAVNDTPLTDHLLEKTIEIGYRGLENVIAFTAVITLPRDYRSNSIEIPTGYLTHEFNQYWRYDPQTDALTQPESEPLNAPWSFQQHSLLPPILSTSSGSHAMGAYSAEPIQVYGMYGTNAGDPRDRTNKWNISIRQEPAPAGAYTYRSFVIVGTLDMVRETMRELYRLHPADFNPPRGYIDVASCTEIAGWAWDPKTPDKPVEVKFYNLMADGSMEPLGTLTASNLRQDLVAALGDNGEHGYSISTSQLIHDNRPVVLVAEAANSDARLSPRRLYGSGRDLACPQFGPPRTPTAEPTPQPAATQTPPPTAAPSVPGLPCAAGLLPLLIGAMLTLRQPPWPPRKP